MSIVRRTTRPVARDRDDGLIPMINIVFLLLVFFMIAGQIVPRDERLELPASESRTELAVVHVAISIDADGRMEIDGEPVADDPFAALQARLAVATGAEPAIVCRVHRALPVSAIDPLLSAARRLGVGRLQIATEWQP